MTGNALDGLRVLDLTSGSFGYAGRLLAGLGADVIKIEAPEGDPARQQPPFIHDRPDPERAARHLHFNAGKRSVVLDLDTEAGREHLRSLVATADAVVESLGVGYLAGRGLGYDDLVALRPDLVMASISYFGQTGPYSHWAGSEVVSMALGGYLYITGDPDREPVKCYDNLIEQQTALQAAVATMVGLTNRDFTGQGDYFDVSAQDAALFLLGGSAQTSYFAGKVYPRVGTRILYPQPESFYPSTIRPCKDGHVHAHTNIRYPDLMATLMEQPRFAEPDVLATPMGHADEFDRLMDEWLAQYDKFEVVRRAQAVRLPFTEVLTPSEIVADEHLQERGFLVEIEQPTGERIRMPGAPITMTVTPWTPLPAPLLGQHTTEVLDSVSSATGGTNG